jgi:hypothetical protein
MLDLIREQLGVKKGPPPRRGKDEGEKTPPPIPRPSQRLTQIKLTLRDMSVGKTANLQHYLFKVIQEHDAGARITLHVDIDSDAGIPRDEIERRIVQGLDQLEISVEWTPD